MGERSNIEWTTHTFNPWRGCTKVSPGCANCYADRQSKRNPGTLGVWGPDGSRVVAAEAGWRKVLRWDRDAKRHAQAWDLHVELCRQSGIADPVAEWIARDEGNHPGTRRHRVFCASMADVFEGWAEPVSVSDGRVLVRPHLGSENVPANWHAADAEIHARDPQGWKLITLDDLRARLFRLIDATPNLDWLLLTKRPESIEKLTPEHEPRRQCSAGNRDIVRGNVWSGTSVESQDQIERVVRLLDTPASLRFLSIEPMLGPIDLTRIKLNGGYELDALRGRSKGTVTRDVIPCARIDWVIVGGESGHGARPMHPEWARSLRDQCQSAGVPFFFKQWGEFLPAGCDGATVAGRQFLNASDQPDRVGKERAGRLLDGRTWDEAPLIGVRS